MTRFAGSLRFLAGLVFFVTVTTATPSRADTMDDIFATGLSALDAGRYEEAEEAFRTMVGKYQSRAPGVLVNLGVAELGAGRPGWAIVAFHQAIKFAPDSDFAQTAKVNLERVRAILNDRQGRADQVEAFVFGPYSDVWTVLFGWVDPGISLWIFLGLWTVFFVLLGLRKLDLLKMTWALTVIIAVGLGLTLSGGVTYASHLANDIDIGVIVTDGAPLLAEISDMEPEMTLPEGLEVRIVETRGEWLKARLTSSFEGWLSRKFVGTP